MADNVLVGNESGQANDYTVASDDDGTAQHQYVKLEWGADGAFTKVASGASAIPIQDGGNSITVDGTVAATLSEPISVDDNAGSLTVDNPQLSVVGGGTEAAAMRVTIANNSTGLISIDDNGGSLTVDAPIATPVNVQIGDGTDTATVRDLAGGDALNVAMVDGTGAQITSFGGGTQYTEADIDASITGTAIMWEDTSDTLRATSAATPLPVNVVAGGTSGVQYTEADIDASVTGTAVMWEDTSDTLRAASVAKPLPIQISDGVDVATVNASGGLVVGAVPGHFNIGDGTFGVEILASGADNTANTVNELITAGFNYVFDGTAWDRLPGNSTDGALVNLGTNNDVTVTGTVTATPATVGGGTEAAAARVTIANDSTGVLSVDDNGGSLTVDGTVTASGTVTANQGTAGTAWEVVGDVAHDAAAPANPVVAGGQMETMADTAPGTRSSADGDATKFATADGAQYVITTGPQTWSYHEDSSSALTDTSVHAAPGAGLSLYVTDIIISTGAATALNVFFEEGASKVLGPYYLEAVAGRGFALNLTTPKKITANTALTVTTSAAIAHSIDVLGFVAPG